MNVTKSNTYLKKHIFWFLYENHIRVIMSAADTPENLYSGKDHAYEFERTISRLKEMQSEDYLADNAAL